MLLGFAEQGNYEDIILEMNQGDFLILVTDGIIESRNSNGVQFGLDRLKDVIANITPGDDPIEPIKKSFNNFTNEKFEDDISLIVIKAK